MARGHHALLLGTYVDYGLVDYRKFNYAHKAHLESNFVHARPRRHLESFFVNLYYLLVSSGKSK